jgi:recombinational DNA repair protein (RecF pathway)
MEYLGVLHAFTWRENHENAQLRQAEIRNLYLGISDQIFIVLKLKYCCSVEGKIVNAGEAILHCGTFSGLCTRC